ncbi:MAG: hypothetical protein R3189_03415, partial [Thiomicrorhabdus chilensis]|uniref:hypothetical protein n=1 Tax=Thiomicrorhabdus chilensis TaxID=63656 RepID=UPI00299E7CC6
EPKRFDLSENKRNLIMKKIILAALLTFGITATASAHHFSANPDAGSNIPDQSAHLTMEF